VYCTVGGRGMYTSGALYRPVSGQICISFEVQNVQTLRKGGRAKCRYADNLHSPTHRMNWI